MSKPSKAQSYESLLANESVLILNPSLAQAIGLEASVVLRQLAYWLEQNEKKGRENLFRDGRWWAFNSYQDWVDENFPFLSVSTIRRLFAQLEGLGLVNSTQKYNPSPMLQSKWYSIDRRAYNAFMSLWEAVGQPAAHGSKAATKAAYARFLQDWEGIKAQLALSADLPMPSQPNASSFPPNSSDGVKNEPFFQAELGSELLQNFGSWSAAFGHSQAQDKPLKQGAADSDAQVGLIPRQSEVMEAASSDNLDLEAGFIPRQSEIAETAIPRQPDIADAYPNLQSDIVDVTPAYDLELEAGFIPRQQEIPETAIPRQPELLDNALSRPPAISSKLSSAPRLKIGNFTLHAEQLSGQTEQEDAQLEQSIYSDRAGHLPKLSSPIKETNTETKAENQKEIQAQKQKELASQSEAYAPTRFLKASQDLELKERALLSVKTLDGVGDSVSSNSNPIVVDLETVGAKILKSDIGSGFEAKTRGFAPADSTQVAPQKADLSHSEAKNRAQAAPQQADLSHNKANNSAQVAPQKADLSLSKANNSDQNTPQKADLSHSKANNSDQNTPQKADLSHSKAKTAPISPETANSPRNESENTGVSQQANSSRIRPKIAQTMPQKAHSSAKLAQDKSAAQKPAVQGKVLRQTEVSTGLSLESKGTNGRRATKGEAKRLQNRDGVAAASAADKPLNLYAEVVRRVFSSPNEILKAETAFVGLWIGFFRGSLKDTAMKSHKSHQLSAEPMDPATILAFSLWYCERYKQDSLPRSPEILRARCDEFRALASLETCLEKGRAKLESLKTALATGTETQALAQPQSPEAFSYANASRPIDETDMQDFDWQAFFKE